MAENISGSVAWRLRKAIKGVSGGEARQSGTARVTRRDSDGTVWLRMPGSTIDTPVTGAVVASVAVGDAVTYSIDGGRVTVAGNATDPSAGVKAVSAVRRVANAARSLAKGASDIATATGQHFWHDDNGAHISTTDRDPAGARNAVWNSLGMLFRSGTTNLLAIVAGTDSGMDVYDGQGNEDENVIASHRGSGTRIGYADSFNTIIQAAQFAIRYATDRLFNVSTDGYSTNIYMGSSTLPSGFKYTDNQVFTIHDYLTDGCTVSGHVVLDPDGGDTTWRLSDDGYGFLYDASGTLIIGPGTGEIEYLPSTGTWEINPPLAPQSEIPGAPVSIDMGNVGIRAANERLTIMAAGVAEGGGTTASGSHSHAEGSYTTASGTSSHAEGSDTTAEKAYSHAEGYDTTASGTQSHAEGLHATAGGISSHAEGAYTTAGGDYSHAQNQGTIAGYPNQTVIGRYNDNGYSALEIGNGTSDSTRSNALTVAWDGTTTHGGDVAWTALTLNSGATAYDANRTPKVRKWGPVVALTGAAKPTAEVAAGSTLTICTLPDGCRPAQEVTSLQQGSSDAYWLLRITTAGLVTAERHRNRTGNTAMGTSEWLPLNVTFMV